MGTSSSYNGVSGNTNLLPNGWLDDNIISDLIGPASNGENYSQNEINKAKSTWKANISNVKGKFTRSYNNRSTNSIKSALASYKNVYGGRNGYIKHLSSYSGSITNLGIALNKLSGQGEAGVRYLNIDTQGKSTDEILVSISEALSPSGDTKDNTVIREAIIQTLNDLEGIEILDDSSNIDEGKYNDIMRQYISNLLLSDVLTFMGTNLDKLLPSQRKEYEKELKRCIDVNVFNKFRDFDFNMDVSVDELKKTMSDITETIADMFEEGDSSD